MSTPPGTPLRAANAYIAAVDGGNFLVPSGETGGPFPKEKRGKKKEEEEERGGRRKRRKKKEEEWVAKIECGIFKYSASKYHIMLYFFVW